MKFKLAAVAAVVGALGAGAAPAHALDTVVTGVAGTQLSVGAAATPANITLTKGGANSADSTVVATGLGNWTLRAYEAGGDGKLSSTVPAAFTLTNPLQIAFNGGAGFGTFANLTASAGTGPSFDGAGVQTVPVRYYQPIVDADMSGLTPGQILTSTVTWDLVGR
jgi:hypothetical protein